MKEVELVEEPAQGGEEAPPEAEVEKQELVEGCSAPPCLSSSCGS